jgi:hypothetical protein
VLASIAVTAAQSSLAAGAAEQLSATGTTPTGDNLTALQAPIADPASHPVVKQQPAGRSRGPGHRPRHRPLPRYRDDHRGVRRGHRQRHDNRHSGDLKDPVAHRFAGRRDRLLPGLERS